MGVLAHDTVFLSLNVGGSEFGDVARSGTPRPVTYRCRSTARVCDHADSDAVAVDDGLQLVHVAHRHPADLVSDERRLTVQDGRDPEAAGDETPVISQGAPEVTCTDDHARPALRE